MFIAFYQKVSVSSEHDEKNEGKAHLKPACISRKF
jgi:hypothetical protein